MGALDIYLMMDPDADGDGFGRSLDARTIINGLRALNPDINVWQQFPEFHVWPGREQGTTCLWLGDPGGESRKITAFNMGVVPEFTQVDDEGNVIVKGWREIFRRVMKCGAATRRQLELKFSVTLTVDGKTDYCEKCLARSGTYVKSHNASGLCVIHEGVRKNLNSINQQRDELDYQQKIHGTKTPLEKENVNRVIIHN